MTVDWVLYSQALEQIQATGKGEVLDRIRRLVSGEDDSDEEKRLDVIFVYRHDEFPEDDNELRRMYIAWIDRTWGAAEEAG